MKRLTLIIGLAIGLCVASWAASNTTLTIDPIVNKKRNIHAKRVEIRAVLNDQGTVDYSFVFVRERALVVTFQSGAVEVIREGEDYLTPDPTLFQNFTGTGLPTGSKVLQFIEAFSDAQP